MKVVSFSVWGEHPAFWDGAIANARLMPEIYPGWEMWVYTDAASPPALTDLGVRVVRVPPDERQQHPWCGLFWRFQPIHADGVTHTIVRDTDSRINAREAAAVAAWLDSGCLLHVMRDHIEHTTVPILGGMFGMRHWGRFGDLLDAWLPEWRAEKGTDQVFLRERVWPEVRHDCVGHDRWPEGTQQGDYHYRPQDFFGAHDLRPFPEHAPVDPVLYGDHVGARVGL